MLRLLLVHPDERLKSAIEAALSSARLRVEIFVAPTPESLRTELEDLPDLILAPVDGDVGALATLAILRERGLDVPVVAVSAPIGEEAAIDLLRGGVHDFLHSDRLDRLAECIERQLARAAERRRVAEGLRAIRESEERLDAFVTTAMDAIVSVDDEQRILMFNPAAERVFGWKANEIIGERLDLLLPDRYRWIHSAHVRDFGISGVTGRTMANLAPLSGCRKDGTEFPIEATISQATVEGRTFYTAVVRDISERRRLESELLQAQKMEAIGRLAGGIAHDFNNLLTAITGYTEIAAMETTSPEVSESLHEVLAAAQRASSLTRQLLTLSRKQPNEIRVLDPNEVVTEVLNMLRRVLGEDIDLVTELEDDIGTVMADRGQLQQILLNLAVNARDAMPDGGRLEISTGRSEINQGTAPGNRSGEYVAISVTDSGVGIPEEARTRIFEPFYTTKPQGKGTGLGLSIVRNIVESHQGAITVEDAPSHHGTRFTLYLPVQSAEADAAGVQAVRAHASGSETVLLIEDDEQLRQLETRVLNRYGYTVHSFSRPADALSAAIPYVDLLVADVVLPGMSGPAAARNLAKRWPSLKVLFLSGYTGESLGELETMDDGQVLLQKPFTPQDLARKVRELLDERRAG